MEIIDTSNKNNKEYIEIPEVPFVIQTSGDKEKYLVFQKPDDKIYSLIKLTGNFIGFNYGNYNKSNVIKALNNGSWKFINSKLILGDG